MDRYDGQGLIQEVCELTYMLRKEPVLVGLREMIVRHGLQPDNVLLAGYLEGEEGLQSGVIVTRNRIGYMFSRRVSSSAASEFWEEITDWELASHDYPGMCVVEGLIDSL